MLKEEKNCRKDYLKKIKFYQDPLNTYTSDDCSEERSTYFYKPSFHCSQCYLIPFITLKENDNKVEIHCSNGHNKEMSLNDFMENYLQKNLSYIKCSDCGHKLEPTKRFKFCSVCVKIFCKSCLKKHNTNLITSNHETISVRKMDTFCCMHNYKYSHYCETCHKNICENCFYLHGHHQILCLKDIKIKKNEVKELKEKINKENNIINDIVDLFNKTIDSIRDKFEGVVKQKRQNVEFKKTLEEIYEAKESNFQIIDNLNRLKFNNKGIIIESDMNELDTLFEIFKYLNCVDYTGLSNILSNYNGNSNQNNNVTEEESSTLNKYKEKLFINNNCENTFNKENKTKIINNNVFIYENKDKEYYDNVMNKNEEEEKDNTLFKNKNSFIPKIIEDKNYENENINDNNDCEKIIRKYSKKIMKGKMSFKKENQNNNTKDIQEGKNNSITITKIYDEEIPSSVKNHIGNNEIPSFRYEEKDKDSNSNINHSFKTNNSTDENLNINNELNIINQKQKELSETNTKSIDTLKKRINKTNNQDNSVDKILEKVNNKKRDRSKEKRIKIKKEDLELYKDNLDQLNRSFDNVINNNSFDYIYHYNKENQDNQENSINLSNIDRSFFSEKKNPKKRKIINNLEGMKLFNKNFDKETMKCNENVSDENINDENINDANINDENIQKEVENDVTNENKEKDEILNLTISNINEDKVENNGKIKDLDLLDSNIFDVIEYKTDDNYMNNENEINNNCVNIDNGNDKKTKKKKKKVIKKKKKIIKKVRKSDLISVSSQAALDLNEKSKKRKKIKTYKKKKIDLSRSFDGVTEKTKTKINILKTNIETKTIQRSNSQELLNNIFELDNTSKINSIKFNNGISCLLEISPDTFAAGNLIGDIKIIDKYTYKELQTIKEHKGTINSLFKMQDEAILTASADRSMKKIRLTENNSHYYVEFLFNGYESYVFKGIELYNNKIISCSWDDKLFLWENNNEKYINSLKFNEKQRVDDILEITNDTFCSVSEKELKIWDSNNLTQIHSIKFNVGIITQNSLCKINDKLLISVSFNAIHLIDLVNYNLINSIKMDKDSLSCITKLNDGSILIAEDINTDNYSIFYLRQYIIEDNELIYVSYKKDKLRKTNKNNDKEIRALLQFSNGIIAEGISGEFNGTDSGDIYFYE